MNIEQYIKENRKSFNKGALPTEHQERFLKKLRTEEKKDYGRHCSVVIIIRTFFSVATVFLMVFIIGELLGVITEKDYMAIMLQEEEEVMLLISKSDDFTGRLMMNALENITFEAIPLEEQLPKEISYEERKQILQQYYKQKAEGIQEIKAVLKRGTN